METYIYNIAAGLAFIFIAIGVWRFFKSRQRNKEDQWEKIAAELGLSYQIVERNWWNGLNRYRSGSLSNWEITGAFNGCQIKIFEKTLDIAESANDYTHLEVCFPKKLPFSLLIKRKRFQDRVALFLHLKKTVLIGEANFDSKFLVQSDAESNAIALLNSPEKRTTIEKLIELNENIRIENNCIYFSSISSDDNLQEYKKTLETMTSAAKILCV